MIANPAPPNNQLNVGMSLSTDDENMLALAIIAPVIIKVAP